MEGIKKELQIICRKTVNYTTFVGEISKKNYPALYSDRKKVHKKFLDGLQYKTFSILCAMLFLIVQRSVALKQKLFSSETE